MHCIFSVSEFVFFQVWNVKEIEINNIPIQKKNKKKGVVRSYRYFTEGKHASRNSMKHSRKKNKRTTAFDVTRPPAPDTYTHARKIYLNYEFTKSITRSIEFRVCFISTNFTSQTCLTLSSHSRHLLRYLF